MNVRSLDHAAFDSNLLKHGEAIQSYLKGFWLENCSKEKMHRYVDYAMSRFLRTLTLIPKDPGKAVLEIGANPWLLSVLVEDFFEHRSTYCNFFGFGLGDRQVARGDEVLKGPSPGEDRHYEFDQFNVELVMPYPKGSFDVVLFCEILEHLVFDPVNVLPRLRDILRPGGRLILTTPNSVRLANLAAILAGQTVHDCYRPEVETLYGRHNREYTPAEIEHLLRKAGFDDLQIRVEDIHDHGILGHDIASYEAASPVHVPMDLIGLHELAQSYGVEVPRGDNIFAVARRPSA